tara:strand:- start:757 stop:1506 length:750 start_codon:yes stop_codon:yes gene_type:complete
MKNKTKTSILPSVSNFRDIGGYKNTSGSTIKHGMVFRSNHLHNMHEPDIEKILSLKLKTIIDFRSKLERENAPLQKKPKLAKNIEYHPITTKSNSIVYNLVLNGTATGKNVEKLMIKSYGQYVKDHKTQYKNLFDKLFNVENLPLVFNCSAGKDRTGFGAAMILLALEVPIETIFEDYLLTNDCWKPSIVFPKQINQEVKKALLQAHRKYLEASFAEIFKRFGTVEGFLKQFLELDSTKRKNLEKNLLH